MAVTHFGGDQDDVHRFLRIMQCESGGNPDAKNPNSSASGYCLSGTFFCMLSQYLKDSVSTYS